MSPATDVPTLLILTRGPGFERRHKRLLPAALAGAETQLYQQSLADLIECGRRAGARVLVSSPRRLDLDPEVRQIQQREGSFGERFADALARAQSGATGPLLVVGTDTPGLGQKQIARSLELLRNDPESVVLGPAPDGGFYLLASARPLDDVDWQRVSWCSSQTRKTLRRRLERAHRPVRFLDPQADLDRAPDFERWLASAIGIWRPRLADIRRALTQRLQVPIPDRLAAISEPIPLAIRDRAPPR